MGFQLARPDRQVVAMVGDGSWLMMCGELVTAIQEAIPLTVVLVDNHGYGSIGALSRSLGSGGFGTTHAFEVDYVMSAAALGAHAVRAETAEDVGREVRAARERGGVTVIVVETDPLQGVPGYDSAWDVPVAEVTSMEPVRAAREQHQRTFGDAQPVP
jgi:3D-(3,5/4)-trihydroxycyclohexane-1,2-dione acylhydrolase (decyclizing)